MDSSAKILSEITVFMKYAKFNKELGRRETWREICQRNLDMHVKKYPAIAEEIKDVYENFVFNKKVLPSMRSLQFGGKPIEMAPNRLYNCCYLPVDHVLSFSETMFLLLGGTGVGYSVQRKHVSKLPPVRKPIRSRRYLVGDSIEGWADAVKAIMRAYFDGKAMPLFDFSDIREKGAPLVTSGGKAPGPQPLKDCLHNLQKILDSVADGEQLTPLQVHDMMCYIADAVLAGGIRRAALICLFDMDDEDMLACKSGSWWELNPQRGRANNSAVILRHKVKKKDFYALWEKIKASGSGEPGFYLTNNEDWGCNPCCFTGDTLVATADGRNAVSIKQLCEENYRGPVYSALAHSGQVVTAYCSNVWLSKKDAELVLVTLDDGTSFRCTPDHRIMLRNGNFVEAKDLVKGTSLMPFASYKRPDRNYRMIQSNVGRDIAQYLHVAQYYDISKNGYDSQHIHHKDENGFNDLPSNLEAINAQEHNKMHMLGENNAFYKINDMEKWRAAQSRRMSGNSNTNSNGLTSNQMYENILAKTIYSNRKLKHTEILQACNVKFLSSGRLKDMGVDSVDKLAEKAYSEMNHKVVSVVFLQEKEDVYDMTVEGTHNFGIITSKKDDAAITSSGVFVHNCEIALRPYQFCNLCEINGDNIFSQEEFNARAKAASFIGTLQAGYTHFHYLREVWRKTTEKDALIGVGITGIASGAILPLNEEEAASIVVEENIRVAKMIGINVAARTTCIKPSGTTSCVLGSSSGIHGWHDKYYIRNIRLGKNEALYTHIKLFYPELLQDEYFKPQTQAILSLPIKAPTDAILRHESAIELLTRVKRYSDKWVKPGHGRGDNTHNVSATISIKEDEWNSVCDWMWSNRDCYNGLSVLPFSDHSYIQAPFEECSKEKYEELMAKIQDIDLTLVVETTDNTDLKESVACSGGLCEVI